MLGSFRDHLAIISDPTKGALRKRNSGIAERILKDELLLHTEDLLDKRQHGFLRYKSCTTNMIDFSESLVLSINDCHSMGTDVVYFDFSKAFDSVNHDLILQKLKYSYGIDGRFLKFIKNHLCDRD